MCPCRALWRLCVPSAWLWRCAVPCATPADDLPPCVACGASCGQRVRCGVGECIPATHRPACAILCHLTASRAPALALPCLCHHLRPCATPRASCGLWGWCAPLCSCRGMLCPCSLCRDRHPRASFTTSGGIRSGSASVPHPAVICPSFTHICPPLTHIFP